MKEISTESFINMQTAVGLQTEQSFRTDFYFQRDFPENLIFLNHLSWNFLWSWKPEAVNLFRDLDAQLWEKCEQNPRLFLKKIGTIRLWQKANDKLYVKRLQDFAG